MMKPILALTGLFSVLLFSSFTALAATPTMRLEYYHTGDATQEVFSVDRVVIEPLPWSGDPKQAIDSSNLGKYLFEVRDAKTKQLLYSRGFASIYGEWETTDEAKTIKRTFQESLRFPEPSGWLTPAQNRDKRLWFVRDHVAIASALGWGAVAPFYIDLEQPAPANGIPRPGPLDVHLKDDHLQYAITWFALAGAVLIAFGVWVRGRRPG